MVDEVEEIVVGPVQVFEHEHERPLGREVLEEAAPGRERLVAGVAACLRPAGEPDERAQVRLDPGSSAGDRTQLRLGVGLAVAFEDAGLRLDHLAERPERDALSVGEAAPVAPVDQLGMPLDRMEELEHQPALPDPGHADEGDELRRRSSIVRASASSSSATSRARPTS